MSRVLLCYVCVVGWQGAWHRICLGALASCIAVSEPLTLLWRAEAVLGCRGVICDIALPLASHGQAAAICLIAVTTG
jgi:hypothetical protein